jgi:hypothetical protein
VYAWIEWERVLKLWSYVMQLDEEIMGNTIAEKDAFIECKLQLAKDKEDCAHPAGDGPHLDNFIVRV